MAIEWSPQDIQAASNFAAGLAGLAMQGESDKAARDWNKHLLEIQLAQAQIDRDYNASQAEISRNFSREMFDKTNKYNSMQNQVSQMKAAGLNPALAYSGGAGFAPASSPSSTPGSHSGSISGNPMPNTPYSAEMAANLGRIQAETENIQAQTRKLDSEGSILESDAKFRDAYNSGLVEGQHVSIDTSKAEKLEKEADAALKRKQIEQIDQSMSAFNKHIEMLQVQIDSVGLDNVAKRIENQFKTPMFEAQLKQLAANTGLSTSQAFAIVKKLPHEIASLGADTAYKNALSALTEKQSPYYEAATNTVKYQGDVYNVDAQVKGRRERHAQQNSINDFIDFLLHLGK